MLKICAALVEVTRTYSVRRQAAGVDAGVPDHRHAVPMPAQPFGIFGEVVGAHRLLLVAERAVVGRRGVQVAACRPAHSASWWWRARNGGLHHVGRRDAPIGMSVDRLVDRQMAGEHLAEHALAGAARARMIACSDSSLET